MTTATVRRGLAYDVPMTGFTAQFVLPGDLSQDEADRLKAFLQTLVIPPPPEADASES